MRLRAQLEQGEAVRQNLEFELVRARKETGLEKWNATEREGLMSEVNDSMKRQLGLHVLMLFLTQMHEICV